MYCSTKPEAWDGYLERGRARRALGRLKKALVDFSSVIDKKPPHISHEIPNVWANRPDLFGEALLERASAQYELSVLGSRSERSRVAAYASVLADYDTALAQVYLRFELTPVTVFNRALVAELQAADLAATSADAAGERYETVAAGYATYLEATPRAPDARTVREHMAQINAWLRSGKSDTRPTPPASFVLKDVL